MLYSDFYVQASVGAAYFSELVYHRMKVRVFFHRRLFSANEDFLFFYGRNGLTIARGTAAAVADADGAFATR